MKNYVFCYKCNKIYVGDDVSATIEAHPQHNQQIGIEFPGIFVLPEFITPAEENRLVAGMDSQPWAVSQSGRRKQVSFFLYMLDFRVAFHRFIEFLSQFVELWTEDEF